MGDEVDQQTVIGHVFMLRGIGPAPGYPACPDHRINRQMFEVLEADETAMDDAEARRALATVV